MSSDTKLAKSSVVSRFARTVFLLASTATVASMVTTEFFLDDLDDSILNYELIIDADFFEGQLRSGSFRPLSLPRFQVIFLSDADSTTELPPYFQGLLLPYAREIDHGGITMQIYARETSNPKGTLYLAQDTTVLEKREDLITLVLFGITIGILSIAFFVSRVSANYIFSPLQQLRHEILSIEPSETLARVYSDYADREFSEIADSFNKFLSTIENHIDRERSFVRLASHEFRTPLAVISGAIEVLDQRGGLSSLDKKTVDRIRTITDGLKDDVEVLLALARNEETEDIRAQVSVESVIHDLIREFEQSDATFHNRIKLKSDFPLSVVTQPSLVRMLLRNIMQNALLHTRSEILVTLKSDQITIRDYGSGLHAEVAAQFQKNAIPHELAKHKTNFTNRTFGLLISRLAVERLGWTLELIRSDHQGTEFQILTRCDLANY
jgi:signal transduction histidine kinase